jgi:hypothetical protein
MVPIYLVAALFLFWIPGIAGINGELVLPNGARIDETEPSDVEDTTAMRIIVKGNGRITVFQLNNSRAAKKLYAQLPLTVEVENYGDNEKIFYPPEELNTTDTPPADAQTGTLAYYAPWGNVVMFYDSFGAAAGLYELGRAVSGSEHIQEMSDTLTIHKGDTP